MWIRFFKDNDNHSFFITPYVETYIDYCYRYFAFGFGYWGIMLEFARKIPIKKD